MGFNSAFKGLIPWYWQINVTYFT